MKIEVISVVRVDFSGFQDKVNNFLSTLKPEDVIDITIKVYDVKFVAIISYKS